MKGNTVTTESTDVLSPADMTETREMSLIDRLREFMETEARSGSMDFGCITPLYVYRAWGGTVAIEDIENGFRELQKQGLPVVLK